MQHSRYQDQVEPQPHYVLLAQQLVLGPQTKEEHGIFVRMTPFTQAAEATEESSGEGLQITHALGRNFALTSEEAIIVATVMQERTLSVIWPPYGVGKGRALNFR